MRRRQQDGFESSLITRTGDRHKVILRRISHRLLVPGLTGEVIFVRYCVEPASSRVRNLGVRMSARHLMIVALLSAVTPLPAAEEEEDGPWAGKATLGFLATSGNTENSTLNSSFEISYKAERWQHLFEAAAINASENNVTTAEAYDIGWKSERDLSEHNFVFGRLNWRKDQFSGYDTQFSQSAGYGRRLINTAVHKLNAEIGVGARQSQLIDGSMEDETILRAGLSYRWKLAENAEFRQDFVLESGAENTYRESATSLSATLIGNFALVASYTVKNNSVVPALTEKTDTYTAVSLEYTF